MQSIGSTEVKVKANGTKAETKRKSRRKAGAPKETLHLKSKNAASALSTDDVNGMIATAAYFCAEQRRFEPGHELEDWLMAERQIKAALAPDASAGQ